ncbi:MAG: cytochrome P450 [Dehalococcoidia bacterium]
MAFFNPGRPSYIQDPYPALHRLREEAPVYRSRDLDAWVVTSYAECLAVLQDHQRYSSDVGSAAGRLGERVRKVKRASVLGAAPRIAQVDPPQHTRLREVVARAFAPRQVEAVRPQIEAHVSALLADVEAGQPFDLVRQFCDALPAAMVSAQMGAPPEDRAQVLAWARALMQTEGADLTRERRRDAEAAREGLRGYLGRVAAGETGDPESLIAVMARAGTAEERLGLDELLALVIDLSLAGNDNTANLVGNAVLALAEHPEQQALLRGRPELLGSAVEEVMRYDAPQQAVVRVVTSDGVLGRERLRAGEVVVLMLGAANRDPAVFDDPDRFDVTRAGPRHLTFAMGIHFCIGAPLARMVGEAALRGLLDRFEPLRLVEGAPLPRSADWMTRSARRILVDTSTLR